MENEKIIEILNDWNFWKKDLNIGVYREKYLERINKLLKTEQVIAITGVRRSGKSTLMKQFIKKHIDFGKDRRSFLYINFEEPKFTGLLSLEFLEQIYQAFIEIVKPEEKPVILLDEVQNVPMWEKFVRGYSEKNEAYFIISGSSSKLLSKEFGSLLTGRWLEIKVYPLDFREFLEFQNLKIIDKLDIISKKIKIKQLLREYIEFGGFPLVTLKEEKEDILIRTFDDIIIRDIGERYNIRRLDKLKILAKRYLTDFSCLISYRNIAKAVGLSLDSVERISSYMQDAYLIYFINKFSYSLKKQEINPRKVYCIDSGLINIVSFRFMENIGRLYENLVFQSLMQNGKEVYYFKEKGECDFIIKEKQKIIQLIQVCYNINDPDTKKREIDSLLEASAKLKCNNLLVITDDQEKEEKIKGKKIKYAPLWKWLLKE
jgi:predicted AAA+ superfamily ATPase